MSLRVGSLEGLGVGKIEGNGVAVGAGEGLPIGLEVSTILRVLRARSQTDIQAGGGSTW